MTPLIAIARRQGTAHHPKRRRHEEEGSEEGGQQVAHDPVSRTGASGHPKAAGCGRVEEEPHRPGRGEDLGMSSEKRGRRVDGQRGPERDRVAGGKSQGAR